MPVDVKHAQHALQTYVQAPEGRRLVAGGASHQCKPPVQATSASHQCKPPVQATSKEDKIMQAPIGAMEKIQFTTAPTRA
jgi:hypothetical protein